MPKINIDYDTETKQMTCSVDGDQVSMDWAGFYKEGDQYRMEIGLKTEEKEGMRKYGSLVASASKNTKAFGKYFLVPVSDWFSNVLKK